jgi:DNA-directed RNA polymerase subunit L
MSHCEVGPELDDAITLAYTVATLVNSSEEVLGFGERILALSYAIEIMRDAVNVQTDGETREAALKTVSEIVGRLEKLTRHGPTSLLKRLV